MITTCVRCGHEIDTDSVEGAEQGITRAWDGEDGYRDYHRLCRDLTVKERRAERRPGQVEASQNVRRKPGPKPKQPAGQGVPVPVDEMD